MNRFDYFNNTTNKSLLVCSLHLSRICVIILIHDFKIIKLFIISINKFSKENKKFTIRKNIEII